MGYGAFPTGEQSAQRLPLVLHITSAQGPAGEADEVFPL